MDRIDAIGCVKWAKEIEAYANGKTIEYYDTFSGEWVECKTPAFSERYLYRIKPEPKLIPFDLTDVEKLIGKVVKNKNNENTYIIVGISLYSVCVGSNWHSFEVFLEHFTFLDGSPCGKHEVQE